MFGGKSMFGGKACFGGEGKGGLTGMPIPHLKIAQHWRQRATVARVDAAQLTTDTCTLKRLDLMTMHASDADFTSTCDLHVIKVLGTGIVYRAWVLGIVHWWWVLQQYTLQASSRHNSCVCME